ncbi:LacI family DNA-binding transcriptional regulator [Actinomadura kijaniata]|uniref:LacI family DNA-binding transcriptional regulator n=1 Tax=Actinomadura kijaniata TaxID=46161 RepID=UPI002FE786F1
MVDHAPAARPATSTDVARLAGVSQATVSYVLNDAPGVKISEETRERVRRAAEELGYAPHASARVLRKGTSDIVLLPLPPFQIGGLFLSWLNDVGERLRQHGHTVVLYGDTRSKGVAAAREWAQWRPAAVIVEAHRLTRAAVRQLYAAGTATVIAIGAEPSPLVPTLLVDDYGVGATAADHLLDRGRTRLAAVVPAEPGLDAWGERRLAGVARTAAARGLEARRVDLPFDEDAAAALAASWAAGADRPDGVFGYNDDYAALLLAALGDAGIDVPGQIAVVGADDQPVARLVRPRLTSVRVTGRLDDDAVAARLHEMIVSRDRDPATVLPVNDFAIAQRDSG